MSSLHVFTKSVFAARLYYKSSLHVFTTCLYYTSSLHVFITCLYYASLLPEQGLRIAVNRELHVLEQALPQAVELLRPGAL